ncbi:hypothetical protein BPTFM16_01126 [Altererythrobacter insulae]|nr:hypothetical protein BPTFM16_01126 [Altererythrobacter insulae]
MKLADWQVERGIGEDRALLLNGDEVLAAKVYWPGELFAGQIVNATLVSRTSGSSRGTAEIEQGTKVLLDRIPPSLSEGSALEIAITRPPIAERGRLKLAQGRVTDGILRGKKSPFDGLDAQTTRRFPSGAWEEVWQAAASGQLEFAGGSLTFSVTPAMTLIDIDGDLPPRELALASVPAIVQGLRWFDLGGSIGIDFPTVSAKEDRKAVDEALSAALFDWPHERTAMNGFGFVQIVARHDGPSLLHRFASSRVGICARNALRIGELSEGHGPVLLLTVHPALHAKLKGNWINELARRTGKEVRIETDPSLALEAAQAQIIGR